MLNDRLDAFTKYVKEHRSHKNHNLLLNWLMYWRKHLRDEEDEDKLWEGSESNPKNRPAKPEETEE